MKVPFAGAEARPSRQKWWEGDFTSQEIEEALIEINGGPLVYFQDGETVSDFKWPGLTDEQMDDPAFEAVVRADYNNDIPALIEFVLNNELSEWGRELLADFLYRKLEHERTPIYELSLATLTLARAKDFIREKIAAGLPIDRAINEVAAEEGIPETTLVNSWNNKHGSEQRALKAFRGKAKEI